MLTHKSEWSRPVPSSEYPVWQHGVFTLLLVLGWVGLAVTAVFPALPHSPVTLTYVSALRAQLWIPEGWGFFSKPAQEERMLLFRKRDNQWVSASLAPLGLASNTFGLDRVVRAQGVETALLLQGVTLSMWRACNGPIPKCLNDSRPALDEKNISPAPTLCDTVAVARQRPLPWAWRRSASRTTMPSMTAILVIRC